MATTHNWDFIRRIGNQIFANQNEPRWPRCEIGAFVPSKGEGNKCLKGCFELINHTVDSVGIVYGYEFQNLVKVGQGFRVKIIASH